MTGVVCTSPGGGITNEWYESGSGGHFDSIFVTRTDTGGNPDVCGHLVFDNRVRQLKLEFSVAASTDYPYFYLWRRGRGVDDPDSTVQLWAAVDSLHTWQQTGLQPLPLRTAWDGVGAVLILHDEPLVVTDSAFLFGPPIYAAASKIEYALQHWREIEAPDLDSAEVDGTTVTLFWTNHHRNRAIDSTVVFRNGDDHKLLGKDFVTWADTGVPQGTYTYRLKHWTRPVVWHEGQLAFPNSPASDSIVVVIDTATPPPDPLEMYIDGPDLITEDGSYRWSMVTSGGVTPYGPYRWEYKIHGTSTWSVVGTNAFYSRYVWITDPWFWLRATVKDSAADSAVSVLAVETWDPGGGAAAGDQATGVGVRLADGECSPRPFVGDPNRQAWLQRIMTTVQRIEYCRVEPSAR